MKHKILLAILLGGIALVGWTFASLYLDSKKGMRTAQQILNSGGSLEELEEAIGTPTHEYRPGDVPDYVNNIEGFEMRDWALVRQYNKEGLPYWWVLVQFSKDDSEILWFRVAHHGR